MSPAPKCGYDITQGCAGSSTRFVFHARQCDIARCPLSRCLQLWPGPHQLLLSAGRGPGSCASPPGVWGDEFSMGELIFACLQSLSEHKRGMKTLTSKAGPRDDFKRSRNAAGAWLGCGPWGAGGACGCTARPRILLSLRPGAVPWAAGFSLLVPVLSHTENQCPSKR